MSESDDKSIIQILGERYDEIEEIATGGMGIVYRAHDRILDRTVAIKTLLRQERSSTTLVRFQKEAMAISRLRHGSIVEVLDFGVHGDQPYMVLEYIEGFDLDELMDSRGPLPIETISDITHEICSAMEHAHKNGIIHRDLKPSNILLTSGELRIIKLIDFGIATFEEDRRVTRHGVMVGSPTYMSPEQIGGAAVDARSDIYSLGCIVFQMLAGFPPFSEQTSAETMRAHLEDTPPAIELEETDEARQRLVELAYKCLSKDPSERPPSMTEIKDTISGIKRQSPEDVQPVEEKQTVKEDRSASLVVTLCAAVSLAALVSYYLVSRSAATKLPTRSAPRIFIKKIKNNSSALVRNTSLIGDSELARTDLKFATGLDLRGAAVTTNGLRKLEGSSLKSLDLSETLIDDKAADVLSRIPDLEKLYLGDTRITDRFFENLENEQISSLDLERCKITDVGLAIICRKWPELKSLSLSDTRVTPRGLEQLARLKRLTHLDLADLKVSETTFKVIARLPLTNLNLTSVELSSTKVDEICKLRGLRILELGANPLAERDKKKLRDNLKNCDIRDYIERADKGSEEPIVEFLGNRGALED